jgi:hypothetical protein
LPQKRVNECFYEKVINVKADVAAALALGASQRTVQRATVATRREKETLFNQAREEST